MNSVRNSMITAFAVLVGALTVAGSAAAAPDPVVSLTARTVSASSQALSTSADGTGTLVWQQTIGPITEPTGYAIKAARIAFKTTKVTVGKGKKRKTLKRITRTVKAFTVFSESGREIRDISSATSPEGLTTIAWSSLELGGSSVQVRVIRLSSAGKLSKAAVAAPAGSRIRFLRVGSAGRGRSLLVWRNDNGTVSWMEARSLDSRDTLGPKVTITGAPGRYFDSALVVHPGGSATVAWRREFELTARTEVVQIGANGRPGPPVTVSSPTRASAFEPVLAPGAGDSTQLSWSEWDGSDYLLRLARIDQAGRVGRVVAIGSTAIEPKAALGVDAKGNTNVAWLFATGSGKVQARFLRVTPSLRASGAIVLGPATDSIIPSVSLAMTVAPSGIATIAWSAVKPVAFPQPVTLQGIKVGVDGRKQALTTIVPPVAEGEMSDLAHIPVVANGPSDRAYVAFTRQGMRFGSPSVMQLLTWK